MEILPGKPSLAMVEGVGAWYLGAGSRLGLDSRVSNVEPEQSEINS